jgi:predicted AAA+ superfamily ATPase
VLRRGSADSGQGRWDEQIIFGLSFGEYLRFQCRPDETEEDVFRRVPDPLAAYLAKGGFPEHVAVEPSEEQRRRVREDIVERAIRRDLPSVRGTGRRPERFDLERLTRLFVFLAQESGSIFQVSSRARDLEAHRATVTSWVRMLEDGCLIHRIEPFHPASGRAGAKASRRLAMKPKLYVHEHGLIPALAPSADPMSEPRVRAAIAETAVLRHIIDLVPRREAVGYYRRRDNLEIDFLFETSGRRYAVEVTASEHATSRDLGRFRAAAQEAGAEAAVLILAAREEAQADGVRLLPLWQFLWRPSRLLEEKA